jgi:hypothetical protein
MKTPTQDEIEAFFKDPEVEITNYVNDLKRRLSRLLKAQQKIIEMNKETSTKKYNKTASRARPTTYAVGDLVYLRIQGRRMRKVPEGISRPECIK